MISREKAEMLVQFMWEQPILEYMRSIGHPVHPISSINPRESVLTMWMEGGLIETTPVGSYAPHFIARDVKKRYLNVEAPDVLMSLSKLRLQQDRAKDVEKLILVESDYTNIIRYFKEMSELRVMENTFRERLLSELDICRTEMDSRLVLLYECPFSMIVVACVPDPLSVFFFL